MSTCKGISAAAALVCSLALNVTLFAQQARPETSIENAFQLGLIVQDTNGDQIADAVCGHVVVTGQPSAAENTSAANLAARIGYETSALTLPIVVSGNPTPTKGCAAEKASLWVGRAALTGAAAVADKEASEFQMGEGGVFTAPGGLVFVGADAEGLLAAADAYAAHAPYQWSTTGAKLEAIAHAINARLAAQKVESTVELVGVAYQSGQPGIRRVVLQAAGSAPIAAVQTALSAGEGENPLREIRAREVKLIMPDGGTLLLAGGGSGPGVGMAAAAPGGGAGGGGGEGGEGAAPARLLDLHELYGIHGLLTGTPRKMIPESVAAKLYVPAGEAGIQMANLAARLGLETTGITFPIALPATGASPVTITTPVVIAGDNALTQQAKDVLGAPGGAAMDKLIPGQFGKDGAAELPALKAGEGELHVVDRAFGANPALLVRGDDAGAAAAMSYAAGTLPYLWEPSKKFESLEEMRLDIGSFFSLRSSPGQATAALFSLDQWAAKIAAAGKKVSSASVEVDVDEADPKLVKFLKDDVAAKLKTSSVEVKTGTLHAGTKCCSKDPDLHNQSMVIPYRDGKPEFTDDFTIPWEGKHMFELVKKAAAELPKGQPASLEVRVSEGPEERAKIKQQLIDILTKAGASAANVDVLCTYKSGFSWLVDAVEPEFKAKGVNKIKIEAAPYPDPNKMSTTRSPYRWYQELFPVDEVLSRDLSIPLANFDLTLMDSDKGPTYRVHGYSSDGKEVVTKEFNVKTVARPYSDQFPEYETVTVETGWVNLTAGGKTLLDERIESDLESFWDHYQKETIPKMFKFVVQQSNGRVTMDSMPLFDTVLVSYRLSEPNYQLGVGTERISSLEGLEEDTFFNTENQFYMLGNLLAGQHFDYIGRIIPVPYPSRDGEDGQIHIAFYAKDASNPKVRLAWKTEGDPVEHEEKLDLFTMASAGHARLVSARVESGKDGVEGLTWRMPVDFKKENFDDWIRIEEKSRVERSVVSAEREQAQVEWLNKLHAAGIYKDSLDYPHLDNMTFQFEVPLDLRAPEHAKKEIVTADLKVSAPTHARPQITDVTPTPLDASGHFVQWDNPIPPAESEHMMARFATYPGVNVYWMGRSYLGTNMWAADVTLPTPSVLSSMPKATTLKATIIYSGRQHANEVSSTSHIWKLAEELELDPTRHNDLKKVNVIIHPVDNPDGANLSIDLSKIAPNNMHHPGYHASLTSDVSTDQAVEYPIYPESATRRLLWNAWLPDSFQNPHGYPMHEWVQPFSEYTPWVITRMSSQSHTYWITRGWWTSLSYLNDDEHPKSLDFTYGLRDRLAIEMAKNPDVTALDNEENAHYERWQHFDLETWQQPVYKGIRVYMALKASPAAGAGGQGGAGGGVGGPGGLMVRYPDITYDDGYTEAPDETAYGNDLKLIASAGLAFDHAHLAILAEGKLNIHRTQRDAGEGVTWHVERTRPVMPLNEIGVPHADGVKE